MFNKIFKLCSHIYQNIYLYELLFIISNYFIPNIIINTQYYLLIRMTNYSIISILNKAKNNNINLYYKNHIINIFYQIYLISYSASNIYLYANTSAYILTLLNIVYYIRWISLIGYVIISYLVNKLEQIIQHRMINIDQNEPFSMINEIISLCCEILHITPDDNFIQNFMNIGIQMNIHHDPLYEAYLQDINKKNRLEYLNTNYPCKKYFKENFDKCAICLTRYNSKQKYRTLSCMHNFHSTCIDSWIINHNNDMCPLCKKEIF
jgi:hypothetical protein